MPNRIARTLLAPVLALVARDRVRADARLRRRSRSGSTCARPPTDTVQTLPLAMVEVAGSTGAGRLHFHDVAIVIDLSASTRLRSGVDVNENGVVGKASPEIREDYWGAASPELLCDDPGDTIAAAEIAAVRRLLKLLNPERTRVALIAFGDRAELMAPLDATRAAGDRRARRARQAPRLVRRHELRRRARRRARRAARRDERRDRAGRKRSILFLSDGYPTLPPPEPNPGRAAIAAARAAGQKDVHIHSFALGPEAVRGRDVLDLVSRVSNGTLTEIERPGEVLFHLPAVELSDVAEVKLENETVAASPGARSGCSPTAASTASCRSSTGRNLIRVTALGIGGGVQQRRSHRAVSSRRPVSSSRSSSRSRGCVSCCATARSRSSSPARSSARASSAAQRERELRIDVEKQRAPTPPVRAWRRRACFESSGSSDRASSAASCRSTCGSRRRRTPSRSRCRTGRCASFRSARSRP